MGAENAPMGNGREASAATMWQLEVFVAAVELGDWSLVEQRLKVDRYRCRKAVDRLADRLGIEKLLPRVGDRLVIGDRERELARDARRMLDTYAQMQSEVRGGERVVVIRFAAYPAQLKRFAAQAVGEFESKNENVRIELQDLEGRRRRGGGVRSTTQIRDREVDMVIAACGFGEEVPAGLSSLDLYGWRLIAATNDSTAMRAKQTSSGEHLLDVAQLAGRNLLVAPKGHQSRDLLDLFANQDPPWQIAGESEDPEVLVRIATFSDKVAVVPSDSAPEVDSSWPTIVAKGHGALGGKYRVLWREENSTDPQRLRSLSSALATDLACLAKTLRQQTFGALSASTAERRFRKG